MTRAATIIIVPMLRVGMRPRTLQRLRLVMLRFNNEDAGASTTAFQRSALEQ